MARKHTYEELRQKVEYLENQNAELRSLETAVHRQMRAFQVLYDLAIAMTSERSLDDNLQLVVDESRGLLGTETAFIALRDEGRKEIFIHKISPFPSIKHCR